MRCLFFWCVMGAPNFLLLANESPPIWNVFPSNFQFSMTITAHVKIEGQFLRDAEDVIGVFVGTELRGVGRFSTLNPSVEDIVFLQVYSNVSDGEILHFSVYDGSTDETVPAINALSFQGDLTVGDLTNPYLITDNYGPTDIVLSKQSVAENKPIGTVIALLTAHDQDINETFTFDLATGDGDADNTAFRIDGDELLSTIELDYEHKSSYYVRLRATDSKNEYIEKYFVIRLEDINDPPTEVVLSSTIIVENSPLGTSIATIDVVDQDINPSTYVYSFVSGYGDEDNQEFLINGNVLLLNTVLDYETKRTYLVRLRALDESGLLREEPITIQVSNQNERSIALSPSVFLVSESLAPGNIVVTLTAMDPDQDDTHTFLLLNEASTFGISGNELLLLSDLDYESRTLYFLDIIVEDAGGLSTTLRLSITVENEDDASTRIRFLAETIQEGVPIGTLVGYLETDDQDEGATFIYTLVQGVGDAENASFSLIDNAVYTAQALDYEQSPVLSFRVRSTEQGQSSFIEQNFNLRLQNRNEAPTSLQLSNSRVAENRLPGAVVGEMIVTDPDATDTHTFSLVLGTGSEDNALFLIEGNALKTRAVLDYESAATRSIRLRVVDAAGAYHEEQFVITIGDENDAPSNLVISANEIAEGASIGTIVGTFSVTDPDSFTAVQYDLENTVDRFGFDINVANQLVSSRVFDYEAQIFHTLRIRATDGASNTLTQDFVIIVTDQGEAPTDIRLTSLEIAENAAINTVVGDLQTIDPDATDQFTYTLTSGTDSDDNDLFIVRSGQLRNRESFDFESKSTYKVRISSEDQASFRVEKAFVVSVIDQNESPTNIHFNPSPFPENKPHGSRIGVLTATDPDALDAFTYVLVSGVGDEHNQSVFVSEGELFSAKSFDYEQTPALSVRIKVRDRGNATFTKSLTIPIADQNDPHTNLALSFNEIAENLVIGTEIGLISVIDQDQSPITYRIVESSLADAFRLEGSALLSNAVFNFEAQPLFRIVIEATDDDLNTLSSTFQIDITNTDDPPSDILLSHQEVIENQPIRTAVGTFSVLDEDDTGSNDIADIYTFTLVPGEGGNDNRDFQITQNQLVTSIELDYESQSERRIRVMARNRNGDALTSNFVVRIENANDPPQNIQLSQSSIFENEAVGTLIGVLSATDTDTEEVFTYRLGGNLDAISVLDIRGTRLYSLATFNYEARSSYDFEIEVIDRSGGRTKMPFTLQIIDNNDPPIFLATDLSVAENSAANVLVGTISSIEQDVGQALTYRLYPSIDPDFYNDNFYIEAPTGNVYVKVPTALDYEKTPLQKIMVEVVDDGNPPAQARMAYEVRLEDVAETLLPAPLFISPNGDNINDHWVVENVALYANMELIIFSYFGQIIYRTTGYDNEWNGTFNNKPLPRGVYYYVFRHPDGQIAYRGSISMI